MVEKMLNSFPLSNEMLKDLIVLNPEKRHEASSAAG